MRRVSKKKAATVRKANEARAEFLREFARCFACGLGENQVWPPCAVHEMASGPARYAAIQQRAAWLVLCGPCHARLHAENWSVAYQLALKKKHDPAYYDRRLVNTLRGRAPEAVTEDEVNEAGAIE